MLTYARTAIFLAGLSLAVPSQAELAFEGETAAPPPATASSVDCDVALGCQDLPAAAETTTANSVADVAVLGADVASDDAQRLSPLEALSEEAEELAFLPERFLDPNEDETYALIAKDLAAAGELVTGSLPSSAPEEAGLADDTGALTAATEATVAGAPASPSAGEEEPLDVGLQP